MKKTWKITDLLALTVFAVFAVCILAVLLTGAGVYRNLAESGQESYSARTAVRYVTTRVRQGQTVTVEDFGGCEALTIPETVDGKPYVTRVYWYDGFLWELYCAENASLSPEDGEKVMELEHLSFSLEGDLLTARIGDEKVFLYLREVEQP